MKDYHINLQEVREPVKDHALPVTLTEKTIKERKQKVLEKMRERGLDQLLIYGDVEHGSNFEYLVGFYTRFEEALLLINISGDMTLLLGNENLNKTSKARIQATGILVSLFSLPNQPNRTDKTFCEILLEAGISEKKKIGIVGWKLFTSSLEKKQNFYDVPYYIVDSVMKIAGKEHVCNATDIFIGECGVRITNNANEIAHYEYGAALASDCILDAMNAIEEGISELQLGDVLHREGQHTSIVTIASSGPRFIDGNMYPTAKRVEKGEPVSLTVGYRGGSSSRAGYAIQDGSDDRGYAVNVAIPYFKAYTHWLEKLQIGMTGGDLFQSIDEIFPRQIYGWSLCPGHLTAEEEWMCSPVYEGSCEKLQSGMIFQIDIIPSVAGYAGCSAESTVVLANNALKNDIKAQYPDLWERMQTRITYLKEELGIELSKDILPMCSTVAYLRPYLLDKAKAFVKVG